MRYLLIILILNCLFSCQTEENSKITTVTMPDGRSVKVFHLQNKNGVSVDVMEYGATLINIYTPDNKGKLENIVAGYDSVETYFSDNSYFGSIVGRFANRIADGKFKINDTEYSLPRNEKNINHLHGGINGLNKKLFKGTLFINEDNQVVKFNYTSPDGEEGYPGNLDITVSYILNDSNELHIDYQATTDKATIVNLSNHSYFNLSGDCKAGILNHQLQVNADSFLTVDKNLIPKGKPVPVKNTPFDFKMLKTIGRDIALPDSQLIYSNGGYDHNFVLNKSEDTGELQLALRLYEPGSGRTLEVFTDQPGLQFYSGNFFNGGTVGKKGCSYEKYGALVFETQKFPDSPNHPDYPSTLLQPGETYQHHTVLKFEVIEDQSKLTYTNPIINQGLADPNIKYENGFYYLLATGKALDNRYIPIYRSKDLVSWEFVRGAVERGGKTDWNYRNFWAPEVYKIDNKFYLYYTASPEESPANSGNRIGLAVADSIQGPYLDKGVIVPHAAIDGHVYFEKEKPMCIFYTIEHGNKDGLKAGQIYVDKLISPTQVAGEPVQIISHHRWQEGPFILQKDDLYFLTYSCGNWTDSTYHVRYATAKSVMGPYTEQPDTILKTNKEVKGPGHHSFYIDKKGKDWIVYHGWDPAHTTRYPRIDRIFVKDNKISSDGPTYTPQSIDK